MTTLNKILVIFSSFTWKKVWYSPNMRYTFTRAQPTDQLTRSYPWIRGNYDLFQYHSPLGV